MFKLTAKESAQAVNGQIICGNPDTVFTGITTDSRKIEPGMLFVPLAGDKFDGHDFIPTALQQGAAGVMACREQEDFPADCVCIKVEDTLLAFKDLASAFRSQFAIPFIQITGSVGKTTAKEMIWSVVSQRGKALKTEGNFNNHIGTPLTLFNLDEEDKYAVIETGMDHAGEINYLGEMVRPDIAVITNVGDAHIENLGSRQGILAAKCEIFNNLSPHGTAVLNGDDELLKTVKLDNYIVLCGYGDNCDVRVTDFADKGFKGSSFRIVTSKETYNVDIGIPGEHLAYAAAQAVACGELLGLDAADIIKGVESFRPTGSRLNIIRLAGDRIIIDDCYNANPQSMAASIRLLAKSEGKKIAVLGDMLCLGDIASSAHFEMGELCKDLGIDVVCAVGDLASEIKNGAGEKAVLFADNSSALEYLKKEFTPGSAVLVKASHAMNFAEIVKGLTL